jgi:TolB protein
MKNFPLCVFLIAASAAFAADAPRKIGFARDDNTVWIANLDGSGAKRIATGAVDPDISPDGTKLAFNTEDSNSSARRIAVADLGTGKIAVFKDVPTDNAFGPVWAPDGTKLAFYIFIDSIWDIGVINADGTGFRILKQGGANSESYFSVSWRPDGQSLYCQDLANLYQIGLDGTVIKQWPLKTLFPKGDMDSSARTDVSPDGGTLIVELDMDMDPGRPDWDGPPPAVWAMDLTTEETRPLTPIFWWEPCWLTADEFLCISQGAKEKEPSIYRVSLDGKTHKLLIKHATDPSVSK